MKSRLILSLLLLPLAALAANPKTIFTQLQHPEVREITLRTDLAGLLDNRSGEIRDFKSQLEYESGKGQAQAIPLKISVRGKFRLRSCEFPPLRLNFDKDDLKARGLGRHDKLKLVTHCLDDRAGSKDNVLREYLAYRLYNLLTPNSYRVQLVRIRYVDSEGRLSAFHRYGFLIEDTDEMAERIGGEECEDCMNPAPGQLDRKAENLHAFFQYFIGNTDYSVSMVRNLKLVRRPNGQLVPVGYDFDFSGLVNASYAVPQPAVGQLTVQQRVFLGFQAEDSIMLETLELFRARREVLLAEVRGFKLLNQTSRAEVEQYLQSFYTEIDLLLAEGRVQVFQRLRLRYAQLVPSGGEPRYYGVGASARR